MDKINLTNNYSEESSSASPQHHAVGGCASDTSCAAALAGPQLYTQTQYLLAVSGKLELRCVFFYKYFIISNCFHLILKFSEDSIII